MKEIIIGTHNGTFHADEVFAIATVLLLFPKAEVTRIDRRDHEALSKCTLRIDIGEKYNPPKGDFDHHQEGGAGARENGKQLASFGLIWKTFGHKLCGSAVADIVDKRLVQAIDATDIGDSPINGVAGVVTVSSIIKIFNPIPFDNEIDEYSEFMEAISLAQLIVKKYIARIKAELRSRNPVITAAQNAEDPRILVLKEACSWKGIVTSRFPRVLLAVFPDNRTKDWRIQIVSKNRFELPKEWAGKSYDALVKATGIEDVTFCHNSRYIAGAKTYESAIKLAKLALSSM